MIDRDFEAKCLAAFMKNPFYKEEYENAPSEGCKRYLRMNFCYSKAPEVKDYAKAFSKFCAFNNDYYFIVRSLF